MPIYEYHCDECGKDFEELVFSRKAELDVKCKACGSDNIVKLLSGSAVRSAATVGGGSSPGFSPGGHGCGGGGCGCH